MFVKDSEYNCRWLIRGDIEVGSFKEWKNGYAMVEKGTGAELKLRLCHHVYRNEPDQKLQHSAVYKVR